MNSSDLKQSISFERLVQSKNSMGIPIERWEQYLKARAKVKNLNNLEADKYQGKQIKLQIEATIRFNPNFQIQYSDRIEFKSNYFDITSIENIDNRNKWLTLQGVCIK